MRYMKDRTKLLISRYFLPLSFFLILALFSARTAIPQSGVVSFNDWQIPPYAQQVIKFYQDRLYLWLDTLNSDTTVTNTGLFIFHFFAFLSGLGISGEIISKVLVVSCLALSGFFMYFLCLFWKRSSASSFVAGVFYMYTPWIFNRITCGDIPSMMNYLLMPLIFLLYIKSKSSEGKISFGYLVVIPLLLSFTDIKASAISYGFLLLYACFTVILSSRKKADLIINIKSLAVVGGLLLTIYLFYILPLFVSSEGAVSVPLSIDDLLIRSVYASWINVIRLSGNPMYLFLFSASNYAWWPISSLVTVVLVWFAAIIGWRKKEIIIFSVVALIAIFLSTGSNPPFGDLYKWLFLNVPFFQAFRDPDKFTILSCFAYAFLIGETAEWIKGSLNRFSNEIGHLRFRLISRHSSLIVTTALCCVLVFNAQPFFSGDFSGFLHVTDFPKEYSQVYDWLNNQGENSELSGFPRTT